MDMRLEDALLRFRASAARCGEPVDGLTDAQILQGISALLKERLWDQSDLLAAAMERIGSDWSYLVEAARGRFPTAAERLSHATSGV